MSNYIPLIAALLPTIALLVYVYKCDYRQPEPIGQLVKAVVYGVISIGVSLCISYPFGFIGLYPSEVLTVGDAIRSSFFSAAIPEELAKLFMLWLFLRKNKYFDERLDGIVYAVCVSLGFAGLENILYVLQDGEWLTTAITRAIFAVPGHFCYGVLMGYFYSMYKFSEYNRRWNVAMIIVAPVVLHGIYDALLFAMDTIPEWLAVIFLLAFLVFCFYMWKWAKRSIQRHANTDAFHALIFDDDSDDTKTTDPATRDDA